ncbi:ATP-dependent DNA helicase [Pseudodonghicola sp.]|uniref:ATP-dependent DNA helicase n=1 Tax=Pseudodonghicola sp. TaxID=1969463 RepID=UPI003A9712F2
MSQAAIRHVSVRVPWHDSKWNGRVCKDPKGNSACLAVRRTAQNRDDEFETQSAGAAFAELEQMPPCLAERGTFLSPQPFIHRSRLDYSNYSKEHEHILPTPVHVPAYGGVLTPFKWMLREHAWQLSEDLGLDVEESREPQEGKAPQLIVDTPWVQECDNQRSLLEGFHSLLEDGESLVFFYARQTPMAESQARQIVAVARLSATGKVDEYPYDGGKAAGRIRSMVWERPFQHSLRPDPENPGFWTGGVVLPYHELIEAAAKTDDIDLAEFVAEVPSEGYEQFLYASEHVTHGSAITALQAVRTAIDAASKVLPGPWTNYLAWIDSELSRLWTMQGSAPGLGSALSCFDPKFNGTLFALALASEIEEGEDPWPAVEAIFSGARTPPARAPKISSMQSKRFKRLREQEPDRYDLMRLLSCFELTKEQAQTAYARPDILAVLANPYLIFEDTRLSSNPVSLTTIDRGLFPSQKSAAKPALPRECEIDLDEADHPLRLRAIVIEALEQAALQGHTLLSAEILSTAVAELPLSRTVTIDGPTLDLCREEFEGAICVLDYEGTLFAQLGRYDKARDVIASHVQARLKAGTTASVDWPSLVTAKFGDPVAGDEDEQAAQNEKVLALEILERSKIAVLTGPAGTGKTTLLKIFLDQEKVVGRDILLLAPTGKARVRLGQQTGRPEQARTLAQFLNEFGRYDGETARYLVRTDGATAEVTTCIVDESSMLTEDQLASLCSALPKAARLILVGDPQQLPPIGAGRPFVDIINHLDAHDGVGLARLTVSRRQSEGGLVPALSLPDVQLANLFSGKPLPPGEDAVISAGQTPADSTRLKFRSWDTPSDLRETIIDVLAEELGSTGDDLERQVELSLGGTGSGDFIYFNEGCGEKAEAWQILSAHRNMASGSAEINRLIKQTVRAERLASAQRWGRGWRMIPPRGADQITYGDKVMCLRNHSRKRWNREAGQRAGYLANGEVGIVNGDAGKHKLYWTKVEFASQSGESFSFKPGDFSDEGSPYLELAYAVTVHKAQGSEFGAVILVLPRSSNLLTREMLYTALTRQRNRVWILHQGAFSHYRKLRSEFFSETARRSTNLFGAPDMRHLSVQDIGGIRWGWLAAKLVHATRRGDLVSSKSEILIADTLYALEQAGKIRYSFEKPLTDGAGGYRLPDFTIEHEQDTWYWEHCGLMDKADYVERWTQKLSWYAAQGISVWDNNNPSGRLIVTEETKDSGFDSRAIHNLAEHLFGM